MNNTYYGDDATRNPNIILIQQNNATLQNLFENNSKSYEKYMLILQNPPSDLQKVTANASNSSLQEAYAMFNTRLAPTTTAAEATTATVDSTAAGAGAAAGAGSGALTDLSNNVLTDAIAAYKTAVTNGRNMLQATFTQMNTSASNMTNIMNQIGPSGNANRGRVDVGSKLLLTKMEELQSSYEQLMKEITDTPQKFDGNYELSSITVKTHFVKYMFYILFTIVVVGSLCLLHFFPSAAYLDMFILALAGIITVYYGYDYFQNRNNNESTTLRGLPPP
jgi:hypothetical protein